MHIETGAESRKRVLASIINVLSFNIIGQKDDNIFRKSFQLTEKVQIVLP